MSKKKRYMLGALFIVGLVLLWRGCIIHTPEISGVVLDAATKQPVEGAWVRAGMELNTKTLGGDSHSSLILSVPHTRTDKQGRFTIPSKTLTKSIPPFGFGTEVLSIRVGASTPDDKEGIVNYFGGYYRRDLGKGDGDLRELLWRFRKDIEVQIRPVDRTEEEYFHRLQSDYDTCLSDRDGGCDDWELDYAIRKHERYLERYDNPSLVKNPPYGASKWDKMIRYSSALRQLAYLLKNRRLYAEALGTIRQVREFDIRNGLSLHINEYERQIKEFEQDRERGAIK